MKGVFSCAYRMVACVGNTDSAHVELHPLPDFSFSLQAQGQGWPRDKAAVLLHGQSQSQLVY